MGRFVRLARALEAGGFYNGSKVLRAGADRELTIVAAPAAQLAHDEVAAEIDELAGDLAAAGYPSWFGRQLGVTAAAVRADESIPFQSAPPAWSCRVCGELFLDIPPTTCPTCEAPAIGFRNHEAVWYLELSDRSSTVDALAHGPSQIGRVLQGRTDEQLDRRPRPAEWSARETLEHITRRPTRPRTIGLMPVPRSCSSTIGACVWRTWPSCEGSMQRPGSEPAAIPSGGP